MYPYDHFDLLDEKEKNERIANWFITYHRPISFFQIFKWIGIFKFPNFEMNGKFSELQWGFSYKRLTAVGTSKPYRESLAMSIATLALEWHPSMSGMAAIQRFLLVKDLFYMEASYLPSDIINQCQHQESQRREELFRELC